MNKFKVALFDLDGTLLDTEGQYTTIWREIGRKFRPDVPNLETVIKGTTLKQIFEHFFHEENMQSEINDMLNEYEKNMDYSFVKGAEQFVADLKHNGVKCVVVTSSNEIKMQSVRRKIVHFDTLFDKVLTAEMFRASKPDPDCYLLGAKVFNVQKEECVVFEDAYTGLAAGMAAGIYTIGLATYNKREDIIDKCNHVIDDFIGLTFADVEKLLNA